MEGPRQRPILPSDEYKAFVAALEKRAHELLPLAMADAEAQKVGHRLWKQRDHLFTFLKYEGVDWSARWNARTFLWR